MYSHIQDVTAIMGKKQSKTLEELLPYKKNVIS